MIAKTISCHTWNSKKQSMNLISVVYIIKVRVMVSSSYTATSIPSLKPPDEQDMLETAGEIWTNDVLFWIPSHGRASVGRLARTYLQQLYADAGCILEDLLKAMDNRDKWWGRIREIRVRGTAWWWWWWWWWYNKRNSNWKSFVLKKSRCSSGRSIWLIEGTLTGTTSGRSGP